MQINFFAFRLKFMLIGLAVVFFIIGLLRKIAPYMLKHFVLLLFFLPGISFAGDFPAPVCQPPLGMYTIDQQSALNNWALVVQGCRLYEYTCSMFFYTDNTFDEYGRRLYGFYSASYTCTDSGGMSCSAGCEFEGGSCDHNTGQCIRFCLEECGVTGRDCNFNTGICECPAPKGMYGGICKACPNGYQFVSSDQICIGPTGGRDGFVSGVHGSSRYGVESRKRFFGRGGYEIKN